MVTWAEKVAWVGLTVKDVTPDSPLRYSRFSIKLSYNPGLCSYGDGDTLEEAIESATIGLPLDWSSITHRITEHEWAGMSHT